MADKLSVLAKDIKLDEAARDRRRRRKLQKRQLKKITNFFIGANIALGLLITAFALLEHFDPRGERIITERVLISMIGGLTVQAGAIILAAVKGLFRGK